MAVADSYDAMTTDRPYRSGMPPWKAIEELERGTGTAVRPGGCSMLQELTFSARRHPSDTVGKLE